MLRNTFIGIFTTLAVTLYAQETAQEEMADTIIPEPAATRFYTTLDSVPGDTIFTLESPKGYIIESDEVDHPVTIAIKHKNGYIVFDAGLQAYNHDDYSFSQFDFDGKGSEELRIDWVHRMGRSGWIDGWNEYQTGIIIWDLDKKQMLFAFQDHYEYNNWWNGVVTDSVGNWLTNENGDFIMNDSLAGGISSCENYAVNISLKKITIQRSADCPDINYETGIETPADASMYVYEWTKYGLILKK